ncbi:MAG: hypothetical protein PVG75_05090 [Thioalkalispiraceae bacterium]|jgi:hypothetical protein
MTDNENEMEELVLKESLVSAAGLNASTLQIGIRGDPSMRETTGERKRYRSDVDERIDELIPSFQELLLNRSTYQLFVGFNNGEIRTHSVFDPMRQEIHSAEKIADPDYVQRQFPKISYDDKIGLIRETYQNLRNSIYYKNMPQYWQNILGRRSDEWEPMEVFEVVSVISTLKTMREMPTYFMRNVTLNIVQSIVRIQFNCDGTQIVSAENYGKFLEANLP